MSDGLIWLSRYREENLAQGGIKALRLSQLISMDLDIPEGFVITHDTFESFLVEARVLGSIKDVFEKFEELNLEDIRDRVRKIEDTLQQAEIPWNMEMEIIGWLRKLRDEEQALVLRPSYFLASELDKGPEKEEGVEVGEVIHKGVDSESLSSKPLGIKGYLNVISERDFINRLTALWQGYYNYELFKWCKEQGKINPSEIRFGTIIQKVIDCEAYGSITTYTPTAKAQEGKRHLQIRARHGFCSESLYDPTPDLEFYTPKRSSPWDIYLVNKENLEIEDTHVALQAMEFMPSPRGGLRQRPLPPEVSSSPKLTDDMIFALAKVARKIEERYQCPVYLQWGISGEVPWIFECRKLTALKSEIEDRTNVLIETQAEEVDEVFERVEEGEEEVVDEGMAFIPEEENEEEYITAEEETPVIKDIETTATGSPLLIYPDLSLGTKGIKCQASGFVSLDRMIWHGLRKHPLHFIQNRDLKRQLIQYISNTMREYCALDPTGEYFVLLSHLRPEEYLQFEESSAWEDVDGNNADLRWGGIERALRSQEFMDLYELEVEAVKSLREIVSGDLYVILGGISRVDQVYQALDRMEGLDQIKNMGIKTGMYCNTLDSMAVANSMYPEGLMEIYLVNYQAANEDLYGPGARQGMWMGETIDSMFTNLLDHRLDHRYDVLVRLGTEDINVSGLEHLLMMNTPGVIVPPERLGYTAKVANSIAQRITLRHEIEGRGR